MTYHRTKDKKEPLQEQLQALLAIGATYHGKGIIGMGKNYRQVRTMLTDMKIETEACGPPGSELGENDRALLRLSVRRETK